MHRDTRSIGILAGGGVLPREVADAASAHGHSVHVVAIDGEAEIEQFVGHDVTSANWGQVGLMLASFKAARVEDLVIVGRVKRPDLRRLKTDLGFFRSLPEIIRIVASGGDDGVLRRVIRFFERHGMRVVGPADVAPGLLIDRGPLGSQPVPIGLGPDIATGFEAIRRLGPFDVGQAVVVDGGRIIAVEAAEGTDAMLRRLGLRPSGERCGVLVKRPKPGQERRIDLPVIGPETVRNAVRAGLSGIVVEAGGAMAAERAALIREADAAALFVAGVEETWLPPPVTVAKPSGWKRRFAGARTRNARDAHMALDVIDSLRPELSSTAAIVVRGHVLAVEAGEGVEALLDRSASLRQWGATTRRGALGLAARHPPTSALVRRASQAGLACIVWCGVLATLHDRDEINETARRAGIRLIELPRGSSP